MIGRELHDPVVLAKNVYNMDETGIILSFLASQKYVIHKDDWRNYRGATVKRTLVTAVECISADGRCLSLLIIWPATTHRSDWTTHRTPGWHYACSPSGFANITIVLDWYRQVFNPQTKQRANHRHERGLITSVLHQNPPLRGTLSSKQVHKYFHFLTIRQRSDRLTAI